MRKITELIWHCTATPEGREHTVADITKWHKDRGFRTIGYHKVVHLDGHVSEGRPETEEGAHCSAQGKNKGTLGYVYVGGTDKKGQPKDTRTKEQKAAMLRLSREVIKKYGITKISGHNDYDKGKACPCFKVSQDPDLGKLL